MNTLELIKDSCLFGGTVSNERTEEVRTFLDNLEKQLNLHIVSQQRELLIAYCEHILDDCREDDKDVIDNFLESYNN